MVGAGVKTRALATLVVSARGVEGPLGTVGCVDELLLGIERRVRMLEASVLAVEVDWVMSIKVISALTAATYHQTP